MTRMHAYMHNSRGRDSQVLTASATAFMFNMLCLERRGNEAMWQQTRQVLQGPSLVLSQPATPQVSRLPMWVESCGTTW